MRFRTGSCKGWWNSLPRNHRTSTPLSVQANTTSNPHHPTMPPRPNLHHISPPLSTPRPPSTIISLRIPPCRPLHPASHFHIPAAQKLVSTAPNPTIPFSIIPTTWRNATEYLALRAPAASQIAAVLPSAARIAAQRRSSDLKREPSSGDNMNPIFEILTRAQQREKTPTPLAKWKILALPTTPPPSPATFVSVRSSLWESTLNRLLTVYRLTLRPCCEEILRWKLARVLLGAVGAFMYMLGIGLVVYVIGLSVDVVGSYVFAPGKPETCHRCEREMRRVEDFWEAAEPSVIRWIVDDRKRYCSPCAGALKEEGYVVGIVRSHGFEIPRVVGYD